MSARLVIVAVALVLGGCVREAARPAAPLTLYTPAISPGADTPDHWAADAQAGSEPVGIGGDDETAPLAPGLTTGEPLPLAASTSSAPDGDASLRRDDGPFPVLPSELAPRGRPQRSWDASRPPSTSQPLSASRVAPARTSRVATIARSTASIPPGGACLAELRRLGIAFTPLAEKHGIETPIELKGPIASVHYELYGPIVIDCRLAVALSWVAPELRALGVTELRLAGAYSYRLSRVGRLSLHAYGLALDVPQLVVHGVRLSVATDYARDLSDGCSETAPALNRIACTLKRTGIFRELLTPDYDADHQDHMHLAIAPLELQSYTSTARPNSVLGSDRAFFGSTSAAAELRSAAGGVSPLGRGGASAPPNEDRHRGPCARRSRGCEATPNEVRARGSRPDPMRVAMRDVAKARRATVATSKTTSVDVAATAPERKTPSADVEAPVGRARKAPSADVMAPAAPVPALVARRASKPQPTSHAAPQEARAGNARIAQGRPPKTNAPHPKRNVAEPALEDDTLPQIVDGSTSPKKLEAQPPPQSSAKSARARHTKARAMPDRGRVKTKSPNFDGEYTL